MAGDEQDSDATVTARALAATSVDTIASAEQDVVEVDTTRRLLHDLQAAGLADRLDDYLPPGDRRCLDDPQAWRCSRATAARMAAC